MKLNVEYLKYEIKPRYEESFPLDWEKFFGRRGELFVEIGFGNGEFLVEMARRYPEKNFVGFELSITSMVKIQKKIHDFRLENVRVVMEDGRFALREFFEDESIETVVTNFPCPWPKKAHEERRITSGDFLDILSVVLKPKGIFELVTDERWYAEEVHEKLIESGYFDVESILENPERPVETRYERKWKSQGKKIFLIRAYKLKKGKVERLLKGGIDLPHVLFQGDVKDEDVFSLEGKVFKKGDKVFVVKNTFKGRSSFLLKVISTDKDFQQQYFLILLKRKNGWLLRLDSVSNPYRTPAVKWSVRKLAEVLSSKEPAVSDHTMHYVDD